MKEYKHEAFVPTKFMVGIDDENSGFPSMKDENGKWKNLSVFEKHCGYKPHIQKDARKEINKVLTQQVKEIENVPTKGFSIVNVFGCVYHTDHFRDVSTAILHDPRGWNISIQLTVLQSLLESNGFNIVNGELVDVELMYCWPKYGDVPFSVTIANDKAKKLQAATTKYVGMRETFVALKPSELEVGKVYSSKTSKLSGHLYLYLGKHDVFSAEAQLKAVMTKNYKHLQEYAKTRNDVTGKSKYVFYCLDSLKEDSYFLRDNHPSYSPYYITGNLSKLFDKCENVDLTKYAMHNDKSKPCTFENIKDDMARSVLFNMVDFSKTHVAAADYQAIEDVFAYLHGYDFPDGALKAFPFSDYGDGIFLIAGNGNYIDSGTTWSGKKYSSVKNFSDFTICACDDYFEVKKPYMLHEYYCNDPVCVYKKYTHGKSKADEKKAFKQLFEDIKPQWQQYVFCNGNEVPPHQNIQLNKRDKYLIAD